MLIFLTLTQECNLKCQYCGGGELYDIEDISHHPHPKYIDFDFSLINKLKSFVGKDDEGLIVCFYGGEPLVKMDLIEKTISMLPKEVKFCLQTNGTLLKGFKLFSKMETILVSVDGCEEVTDLMRGEGTFKRAIEGCLAIRHRGFKNELIARMTVHQHSEIYEDVLFLLNYRDDNSGKYLFDTVHWQLDVLWDTPGLERWGDEFTTWRDENYNPGITKLAKLFNEQLLEKNRILGIAPFLGILYTCLKGKKTKLRCSAGINSFNITTGGKVTNCPIAPEYDIICNIKDDDFSIDKLRRDGKKIGGYCDGCKECGGRCLFANKKIFQEKDEKSFREVCKTVFHILDVVKTEILPVVKKQIERKKFSIDDFRYPKFNNSVEVIP